MRWLGLILVLFAGRAYAGSDPAREWVTITSEHFALHTYDDGVTLAADALAYLEEAHQVVDEVFGWHPRQRVHVTLTDDFDSANGLASTLPYPGIVLYAWPPEPEGELGDFADWLRLLCFHEYTHIVHIDTARGIPELVNDIFGPVWKPNDALPRWATEGLAVWIESTRAGGGRVGSSLSEMNLRTHALADAQPSLSDLTGYPLQHPRGGAWYQYGGYLFDTIARDKGDAAVRAFSQAYAIRVLPFAINTVAKETTGKTMVEWHTQVLAEARERARAVVERVERAGRVEGLAITVGGELNIEPRFSPDGKWLTWIRTNGHEPTRLVRLPVASLDPSHSGKPEPVILCEGGCGAYAFTRDGSKIVYATSRTYRMSNFHGVLAEIPFAGDVPRRTAKTFPETRRAHDPTMDADGKSVWYARAVWGRPELARADLTSGAILETWSPPGTSHARIDRPVASPDGRSLYLSLHLDGNRDLYRLDIQTKALERLTTGASIEVGQSITADGRWLVYASDRDGIYNIYARDLTNGATRQLTNVVGGAFYPVVSPDDSTLVFASWHLEGHDLYALPFTPESAPVVDPPDPRPLRAAEPPHPVATAQHDYQAVQTMLPRAIVPELTLDSSGIATFGIGFEGVDASSRYGVALGLDYTAADEQWSAFATLNIASTYPDLSLTIGRYAYMRESFVGDLTEPYEQEVVYASLGASLYVPSVYTGLTVGMGYTLDLARGAETGLLEHTPDETTPFIPYEGANTALNIYAGFSDVRSYAYSIAPANGVSGFFNFSLRSPYVGSAREAWTFTWVTHAHLEVPGLQDYDHVLGFRFGGGVSGGDPAVRPAFSLGGIPHQDLLNDLLNQTSAGSAWLRGFADGAFGGYSFLLGTAEYRLPLVRVRGGLSTLPIYMEDVSLGAFVDVGGATYDDDFPTKDLHVGTGVELRVRLDLFYGLLSDFRIGYAHGFGPDGIDHVYLLMAGIP